MSLRDFLIPEYLNLPNILLCLKKLIRFFNIHFDQIDISFDSSNKFVFLEWIISIFVTDRVHLVSFYRTFLLMEVDFFQIVDKMLTKCSQNVG